LAGCAFVIAPHQERATWLRHRDATSIGLIIKLSEIEGVCTIYSDKFEVFAWAATVGDCKRYFGSEENITLDIAHHDFRHLQQISLIFSQDMCDVEEAENMSVDTFAVKID
jgi:hypothetical protein